MSKYRPTYNVNTNSHCVQSVIIHKVVTKTVVIWVIRVKSKIFETDSINDRA